jgi:signal transduction histidine kinase
VEKKREEFVSNLSHDFRSPLTSINGYTQAILDGTIPPESQDRYLRIVADESSRLTKMANDILDLSKMQTGAAKLELEEIKIHDFLINELTKFEHRLEEKEVDVQIHFMNKTPIVVADRALLQRVVYNLLDNALKFINHKGTLELKTQADRQKLLVTVRNTGAVIRKEEQARIWERFSKLDTSRGKVKKSSGLGLSIVKEIMRAHEEDIWIESDRETGVAFVFTLPINAWERKQRRNEK